MFTKLSNFTYGKYRIANITSDALNDNLEMIIHIQKYEKECLLLLLGKEYYDLLLSNVSLGADGYYQLTSNAPTEIADLLYGKTYPTPLAIEGNGCGCCSNLGGFWKGLISSVATINNVIITESIMALYIYYHYSLNYRSINLGIGEGRMESKSATQESSKLKRIDAWNDFVAWASRGYPSGGLSFLDFMEINKDKFPNKACFDISTLTYYDI